MFFIRWSLRATTLILAIITLTSTNNAFAASDIIFKADGVMEVTFDGKKSEVDLSSRINAAGDTQGKVVFTNYKSNHLYLLIDVFGPSKIPGGPGYCGAGEEYNLVWMVFDAELNLSDTKSILYDSCLESVAIDPPHDDNRKPRYYAQNGVINLKFISFKNNIKYVLHYDNSIPETGITLTSSPFSIANLKGPVKPSFDCSKATSNVEKSICFDPYLAIADHEMASIYKDLYSRLSHDQQQQLKNEQNAWLKKRNSCGKEQDIAACIRKLYRDRIEILKNEFNKR